MLSQASAGMKYQARMQDKIRRVLRLIDLMAGLGYHKTVEELGELLGGKVSDRTLRRDLDLLCAMGIVIRTSVPSARGDKAVFEISVSRSARLQLVAMQFSE